MSADIETIRIEAIPKPSENPELARTVAVFILREQLGQEPTQEDVRQTMLAMNDRTTIVAFGDDGNLLATAGLAETDNQHNGILDGVAVHQNNRKQGLGRKIIEETEAIAKNHGISHIEVLPAYDTKSFYKKLGYNAVSQGWFAKSIADTK